MINNTDNDCFPLRFISSKVLVLCIETHCHGLLRHYYGTELSLMLLATPVLAMTNKNVCCESDNHQPLEELSKLISH